MRFAEQFCLSNRYRPIFAINLISPLYLNLEKNYSEFAPDVIMNKRNDKRLKLLLNFCVCLFYKFSRIIIFSNTNIWD